MATTDVLEEGADPVTFGRLRAVGVSPGWRCLQVGGGEPVARWLGEAVGPTGLVTAASVQAELKPAAYDLVHCRSLPMRLPDPGAALARMANAVRPNGWLVVENNDYSSLRAFAGHAVPAGDWNHAAAKVLALAQSQSLFGSDLGHRLPGLVAKTGLHIVVADGRTTVRHGRDPVACYLRQSFRHLAHLTAFSAARAEIETLLAGLDDPTFEFIDATNFGVSALHIGRTGCP